MLLQRLFWLISFWPSIYLIQKIIKRKDINCFDLILFFHLVYFSFCPLISNINDFRYDEIKLFKATSVDVTFEMFYVMNVFYLILVLVDFSWSNSKYAKRYNLINITLCLRNISERFNPSNKWLILYYILLAIYSIGGFFIGAVSFDRREADLVGNDPRVLLVGSIVDSIRVIVAIIITIYIYKRYKNKSITLFDKISAALFIATMLLQSRTFQIEVIFSALLCLYAMNKHFANKKLAITGVLLFAVLYTTVFPFMQKYRELKKWDTYFGKVNYSLIDFDVVKRVLNGEASYYENNSSSRKLYLYSIAAKCVDVKPQYGRLTKLCVLYGIPSALYKGKPQTASEYYIEKASGMYLDIADSIILFSIFDYGLLLAPIGSFLIFFSLLFVWDRIIRFFNKTKFDILVNVFGLQSVFVDSVRLEQSPDQFLGAYIRGILIILLLYILAFCVKRIWGFEQINYRR